MPLITLALTVYLLWTLYGLAVDVGTLLVVGVVTPPILIYAYVIPESWRVFFRVHSWIGYTIGWFGCVGWMMVGVWGIDHFFSPGTPSFVGYWMGAKGGPDDLKFSWIMSLVTGSVLWTRLL